MRSIIAERCIKWYNITISIQVKSKTRSMEKRLALFLFALLLSIGTAFGQTKITGTVVSQDDGDPIIGASVMVQGTTMGTVTDIDGKFSLDVPAGKKLVVSYIGMVTQTLSPKAGMRVVLSNSGRNWYDPTGQEIVLWCGNKD